MLLRCRQRLEERENLEGEKNWKRADKNRVSDQEYRQERGADCRSQERRSWRSVAVVEEEGGRGGKKRRGGRGGKKRRGEGSWEEDD